MISRIMKMLCNACEMKKILKKQMKIQHKKKQFIIEWHSYP